MVRGESPRNRATSLVDLPDASNDTTSCSRRVRRGALRKPSPFRRSNRFMASRMPHPPTDSIDVGQQGENDAFELVVRAHGEEVTVYDVHRHGWAIIGRRLLSLA